VVLLLHFSASIPAFNFLYFLFIVKVGKFTYSKLTLTARLTKYSTSFWLPFVAVDEECSGISLPLLLLDLLNSLLAYLVNLDQLPLTIFDVVIFRRSQVLTCLEKFVSSTSGGRIDFS